MFSCAIISLTSCLDFDSPGDELYETSKKLDDTVFSGAADSINYRKNITEAGFDKALSDLGTYFRIGKTAQYAMRGGKEGNTPGAHSYQRQFSLGPDNYAQYTVVPHWKFMYGSLTSTYDFSNEFNQGPFSCYTGFISNNLATILNHPQIDSIPEAKAIYLLLFDYASIEQADIYGPFPYLQYKANQQQADSYTYNDLPTIYKTTVANIDTIVNCLKYFENRPDWYKEKLQYAFINAHLPICNDQFNGVSGVETFWRFANSLKLRMAMHIVKVEPELAQQWAEEAVASGVIEDTKHEVSMRGRVLGFGNPIVEISTSWDDLRLSASFESLLMSLNHPYSKAGYIFNPNIDAIKNEKTKEVMPPNTRIVGIREGSLVGEDKQSSSNPYIAYSNINGNSFEGLINAPLYLMKLSEVDFLRAEGALRGWNMGGTAQFFYERGIDYAYWEDRDFSSNPYMEQLQDYKNLEAPVNYVYKDPQGKTDDLPSVTKIGVKWNEGDDPETKLEKIITQKYIASFPYSYESWVDLRRTGYPKVFPVLNPDDGDGSLKKGEIIHRMPFPMLDPSSQQDIINTGLGALGGPDLQSTRLWWDVETSSNF